MKYTGIIYVKMSYSESDFCTRKDVTLLISWFLKCKDQYFIIDFHIFSLKIQVWNNGKTLNSIKDFRKVARINEDKVKSFQECLNVIFTKKNVNL